MSIGEATMGHRMFGDKGGMLAGSAPEPEGRIAPIPQALQSVTESIDRLTDGLARLHERLHPVLEQVPDAVNKTKSNDRVQPAGCCEFHDVLLGETARLHELEEFVHDMRRRLAI